ncbi:regucalcin [Halyomorpha halys]|uniref:regucalcin n=1 Tax=Halyomorpha halys TaxID=286706 RepID=UPI0006D5296B|nr:regucalcin-like [Halyomorpha halys]XP_014277364.1 regucalcin-like [Halyomorpha halys]XP_024217883.1 regucalcin-like [Halyomorpha halys]
MAPTVEKLPIRPLGVGEGPHWDIETQSLYLIDSAGIAIVRYDLATNKAFIAKPDLAALSFIIPVAGTKGKFIIGSGLKLYIIGWDGLSDKIDSIEVLHELTDALENNSINDAKCDSSGRLWFGTIDMLFFRGANKTNPSGKIYSYSKQEGCREHASGIYLSNGITWNPQEKKMYYNDTYAYSVDSFDCNSDGTIGNRKVIYHFKENNIKAPLPDGLTIDKDGKLWVPLFGSSEVFRIDPKTGKILERVLIPAPEVTSVAWGGPNLEHLYVTTGSIHPEEDMPDLGPVPVCPDEGCTFRVTGLSTSGLPMVPFKL